MAAPKCVAIDRKTGLVTRPATDTESALFLGQLAHPSFRKAVEVNGLLIDEDTGPGIWFGGAGF